MRGRTFVGRTTLWIAAALLAGCADGEVGQTVPDFLGRGLEVWHHQPGHEKPGDPPVVPNAPTGGTSLFVEVFEAGAEGKALPNATVRIVERAGKTDTLGRVVLDNLVQGETLIQVYAPEHVRVSMHTKLDVVHAALRVYLRKRGPEIIITDAANGMTLPGPNDMSFKLEANALVDPLGCTASGEAHAYVTPIEATSELQWMANPPVLIDEGTKTPLPIQLGRLVAIEVEQVKNGDVIPLSLAPGQSIKATMLVDAISGTDVVVPGFGQDKYSGRWVRSSANTSEKLELSGIAGKHRWNAQVEKLGMLAVGLPVLETREIKVQVRGDDKKATKDRAVLVHATTARSASAGFTKQNGDVVLVVPKASAPTLRLPSMNILHPPTPTNVDEVPITVEGPNCTMAGQYETSMGSTSRVYCNGFFLGDAAPHVDPPPDGVGWRCGTGQPGICALGKVTENHTCEQLVKEKFPEICNGIDDDCDGYVDEKVDLTDDEGPCTDSVTGEGTWVCNTFGALVCKPKPMAAEPPGDGIDKVMLCQPGDVKMCGYTGLPENEGKGACIAGTSTCDMNGQWGTCTDSVLPMIEVSSNQVDDDCDGLVDETCSPGDTKNCYNGPVGTSGIGVCHDGIVTCDMSGQWGIACVGETLPMSEVCNNGKDEDCNGQTDENCKCVPGTSETCYSGPAGTSGEGICHSGSKLCGINAEWGPCMGEVPPTTETINMLDDDCDGRIDEPCSVGQTHACYSGDPATKDVGTCKSGTQTCDASEQWGPCTSEVLPRTEFCNALDDDCDGQTDENLFCANVCLAGCAGGIPDGTCASGENSFNCSPDCACGDGTCSGSETAQTCPVDCKFSPDPNGMCGNGYCEPWEVDYPNKKILCQADCWNGMTLPNATCGDATCAPNEDATNCAADCGSLTPHLSGDGMCAPDEHWPTSIDCTPYVDAGTFLEAKCQDYALIEMYADGNGGSIPHTVSSCSESCGAAPWKLLTPYGANTTYNGDVILRPDCVPCTINTDPNAVIGDGYAWGGWVSVYNQETYEMNQDPNKCNLGIAPYNPASPWYSYVVPLEWEKIEEHDCATTICDVRDCAGNHYPVTQGKVGVWKPAYGSWSTLAANCVP